MTVPLEAEAARQWSGPRADAPPAAPIRALTVRLARGEEEAFREFHRDYFDRLFRYHLVMARGDETVAREALQETLLRVVRHARPFDNPEAFWSWLTVLARSAAIDGGRKRLRYLKLLAAYARSLVAARPVPPSAEDADERVLRHLASVLSDLDNRDRSLIEGKYFRRASVRELAQETGLTEKAVESRLLRARQQLRRAVLHQLHDDHET